MQTHLTMKRTDALSLRTIRQAEGGRGGEGGGGRKGEKRGCFSGTVGDMRLSVRTFEPP